MNFQSVSPNRKYIHFKIPFFIPIFCLCMFSSTLAQTNRVEQKSGNIESYQIGKKVNQITIDGSLGEPVWENAISVPLNYERFPEPNAEPPVDTRFYITYDSNNLYVAFKATDPAPETIRAHLMDRDSQEKLQREDHVGFTIDPFDTGQWGFQFIANPLGVQADAVYSNQENTTDYSWDTIWESEGTITKNGYEIEIRIPFSSINVPAESEQSWRFSAFRLYPGK